jgi:uncharacterized membrane protein YkvA (DUF1232 family)
MFRLFRLWRLCRRDLALLWFALRHRSRPLWLLPAVAVLGLFALEPLNFAIPMLGLMDDFIVLPLALHWLVKLLPEDIRSAFSRGSLAR